MARRELPRLRRRSPLAIRTISGFISAWLLRPSHLPVVRRLRSRAALSLATSLAFSYSANDPAIWRIILREGSLLSVRSSPPAVRTRTPRLISASVPSSCVTSSRANREVLDNDGTNAVGFDPVEQRGEAGAGLN